MATAAMAAGGRRTEHCYEISVTPDCNFPAYAEVWRSPSSAVCCPAIQTRRVQDASGNVQRLCAQCLAALGQLQADLALIRRIAPPLGVTEDFQALKQGGESVLDSRKSLAPSSPTV
jgi:hypothetical protein